MLTILSRLQYDWVIIWRKRVSYAIGSILVPPYLHSVRWRMWNRLLIPYRLFVVTRCWKHTSSSQIPCPTVILRNSSMPIWACAISITTVPSWKVSSSRMENWYWKMKTNAHFRVWIRNWWSAQTGQHCSDWKISWLFMLREDTPAVGRKVWNTATRTMNFTTVWWRNCNTKASLCSGNSGRCRTTSSVRPSRRMKIRRHLWQCTPSRTFRQGLVFCFLSPIIIRWEKNASVRWLPSVRKLLWRRRGKCSYSA